jgi:hypothetical protein
MILASSQISFQIIAAGLKKNLMLLKKEGKVISTFER